MGRNTLPDASEWPMYLRNVKPNTRTCRQINAILRMQAAGSQVKTYSLDMAESAHVERAFTLIAEQHSQIDGVIHCAGKVTNSHCLLAQTDDSYIDAHLAGKFAGMRNVDQHVNLVNPEFVLVMSSLSVVLGGFGFAAYSYANAVADAFVMNKRQAGDTRWFSIDWDGWSTHRSDDGIDAVEGVTAIEQGLANAQYSVLVYAQSELEQACDKWLQLDNFATNFLATQSLSTQASAQSVGQHGAVASPMLDGIEQILVKEWQRILGVDEIAVDDDFFVLGGDSLLVARVIGFVRQMFDVSADALNFKAFFANPTIRFLHQVIQESTQQDALSYLSPDMALSEDEEYEEGEF
jgi:acyl carrier protein